MTFPYSKENAESYQRLKSLVHRLTDTDLALSTDYGWTIAALLAHLAFWDQRMFVILRRWQEGGLDESPVDSMAVNDASRSFVRPLSRARPLSFRSSLQNASMQNLTHSPRSS